MGLSGAGLFLSRRRENQHRSRKFRSVRTPSRQATPHRPLPSPSVSTGGFRRRPRLRENFLVLCITPKRFLPSICLMRRKTQAPDDTPNPSLHPSPRKQRSFRFPLYALHPELALLPIAITCRSLNNPGHWDSDVGFFFFFLTLQRTQKCNRGKNPRSGPALSRASAVRPGKAAAGSGGRGRGSEAVRPPRSQVTAAP